MKAAELFVKCLEASDVKYVFGVPGEENLAFVDALSRSAIELITTRDEQSAVFMAATVGRLTGRVGVALSTLGPGATNLVTGVAYAQLGGMPLLVITGQKPIKKSKQGKFQIIDVVGMMRPITKMTETLVSADGVPSTVYQAIRTAEKERPGAVHLELPEDIAEEETDLLPIKWHKLRRPIADQKSIEQVTKAIEQAKKPIIVIANGANRKLVNKQLSNFIDKTKIPFVSTQMGKGVINEESPLYIGTAALSDDDYVHLALDKADLVIMIGHDITEKPPVLDHKHIVHINFYSADIDSVYNPLVEVIGDISHSLWAINEQITPQEHWDFSDFYKFRDSLIKDINDKVNDPSFPIKPQRFVKDLKESMPESGFLSLDNGMYKIWIARNYAARVQNTLLLDNALATMGAGLPVGMAAKLLNPGEKVVVVAGDGGFMMNLADLETAIRLKLDIVIVVLTDSGFGMIKWKQESMSLKDYGLDFSNPDFVKLAESFGAKGYKVDKAEDFKPMLQKVMAESGIHIIDLPIDYSENNKSLGYELKQQVKKSLEN